MKQEEHQGGLGADTTYLEVLEIVERRDQTLQPRVEIVLVPQEESQLQLLRSLQTASVVVLN